MSAKVQIALLDYPGVSRAAVEGLTEMLVRADRLARDAGGMGLAVTRVSDANSARFDAVVVPPAFGSDAFFQPDPRLTEWLVVQANGGALMASGCAGAFYLAAAGLLDGRRVTTHWGLADALGQRFPCVTVQPEHITLTDGPVLTAGGMFSWIDLGLELVARFASLSVMRALGRIFVVDTGRRDQRHFRNFAVPSAHGDAAVQKAERRMANTPAQAWRMVDLAADVAMSERTFQRRFVQATGRTPLTYLQGLRIALAQDLLADGRDSVAQIADRVGYQNENAFRRLFLRETGLSPSDYRRRHIRTPFG